MGCRRLLIPGMRLATTEKRCRYGHYLFCVTLLCLGGSLYFLDFSSECYFAKHPSAGHNHLLLVSDHTVQDVSSGFVVDTPGCRIPALDPFDPLVKKFFKKEEDIDCEGKWPPQLVKSNVTSLYLEPAALAHYNVTDPDQLDCCYRPFWRVDGDLDKFSHGVDDKNEYSKNCTSFQSEARLDKEFVKVECRVNGSEIYTDYFAFTPLKEEVPRDEGDFLSVLVIGIDAVSRLNFHRQMTLTKSLLEENGAVELLGYNKVADNTFPNLIPVLSGLSESELQGVCWKTNKASFDACPWLWRNYSDAGYLTSFGEDAPWMGIFSYLKVGFVHQPTTYYMRPYSKTYEDKMGHTKRMNAKLCIGPRLTVEVLLQYASKFAQTVAKRRSFGFFWGASLSHDYLNYPQLGDAVHERTLRHLVECGALNRTLLIMMSDHGIRWGSIRETYQGRLEERLPLLFMMFPEWFRKKYTIAMTNLRKNVNRLTSPFDLHETLLDVLNLPELENEHLRARLSQHDPEAPSRGMSLFLPVGRSRTCADAGISPHWCTCQQSQPLASDSLVAQQMAAVLVQHVNSLLKPYRACARLKLHSVHDAREQFPLEHLSQNTKTNSVLKDYVLIVQTVPGDALFEATVRQSSTNVTVAGTVSRINTYGNQSACMTDFHMKLYCFCDSFHRLKL